MCALLGYRRGFVALLVIAAQLLPSRVLTAQEIDPKTGEATPVVSAAEKAYLVAKARKLEKINAVRQTNRAEAIRLTRELLRSDQDTFGPNHEHSVTTLNLLAVLYWDSGDLKTAASCQVAIMEIRENLYGKDDWRRNVARWQAEKWKHLASTNDFALAHADAKAAALVNEATQAYADRNYAATIAAAQNAAKIYKDVYGDNVPSYAEALNLVAVSQSDQGKYAEARQIYEQVSAIYEGWHGTISPMYVLYRTYLGVIARTDAERERYYRQAIDICDQMKGYDRTLLANALDGLAGHYLNVGRYAQGEELIVRAMGIEESIRGPQSPALKNMQVHAAGIYRNLGKFAESEALFKSLQAYYDANPNQFASERSFVYDEMGKLYLAQKKYDLAEREIRQAIEIEREAFGETRALSARWLFSLGTVQFEAKQLDAAPETYEQCLVICSKLEGPTAAMQSKLRTICQTCCVPRHRHSTLRGITPLLVQSYSRLSIKHSMCWANSTSE